MGIISDFKEHIQIEDKAIWKQDVRIYHSSAHTLMGAELVRLYAYETLLRICGIPFRIQIRDNAEFISPSGQQPFIRAGQLMFGSYRGLCKNLQACGYLWVDNKDSEQNLMTSEYDLHAGMPALKASESDYDEVEVEVNHADRLDKHTDCAAYLAYVENVLGNAELYWSWYSPANLDDSFARYGSKFTWPLSYIVPKMTQRRVVKKLSTRGWTEKTPDQVVTETDTCFSALNMKLGEDEFFGGVKANELDALIYGCIKCQLEQGDTMQSYPALSLYYDRIKSTYT